MVLKADETFEQAIAVLQMADELAVESDLNIIAVRLDLIGVPLPIGSEARMLAGASLYTAPVRCSGSLNAWIYVRIFPGVIDLNLVALIGGRLPIVCGIGVAECRESDEHA
jgi:hypothetical protein